MNIDGALVIASGGLANINRQMALISQNVANANTPGYVVEISTQQSITANGEGLGVRSGPAIRCVDSALQAEVVSQNATVAGLQTREAALQAIDAVQGTPGQGSDIAGLLGTLRDQVSTLLNSPDNQTRQSQVVAGAAALARGINSLSNAYTAQRQAAQDGVVADVATLNATLGTIGSLSNKIIVLKSAGHSIADLENQRDAAVQTLSQLVDVKLLEQPNGDMLVTTASGFLLPIHGVAAPFAVGGANMQPGSTAPPVTLAGSTVTARLQGGRIGANITLRDTTLPTDQAELDEFAQNLASRFNDQDLRLFTDPGGAVPPDGMVAPVQAPYVGFAATIQVNQAVQTDPSLVRDGTAAAPTGIAGYTAVIRNVLSYTFGTEQAPGVAHPISHTTGLGTSGTLNAPYSVAPLTLGGIAATLVAAQAQDSANTTSQLDTEQAVQTTLANKLAADSGVNMDTEMAHMIQLQNAYGANARVIAAVQAMWSQLMNSVG